MAGEIQRIARDMEVNTLPSVLMKDKNNLPDTPGVYLIESRDAILYIGMTESSLHRRHQQHHRSNQIESQFVDPRIYYYVCTEDSARELESALIQRFNPLLQNTKVVPYTREDIGTETLPQVQDGEVHIKLESIIALIVEVKNTMADLDRTTIRLTERVERLEDLTGTLLQRVNR
jgi:predicted GIY-YIG superfamily endonuclease